MSEEMLFTCIDDLAQCSASSSFTMSRTNTANIPDD